MTTIRERVSWMSLVMFQHPSSCRGGLPLCRLLALLMVVTSQQVSAADGESEPVRRVVVDELLAVRTVHSPCLSPDGEMAAFIVSEPATTDRGHVQNTLWLADTKGVTEPQRIAREQTGVQSPAWSRHGKNLAFLADGDDEADGAQVSLPSQGFGESVRQITSEANGVVKFCWLPDGSHIAFTTPTKANGENDPIVVGRSDPNSVLCVVDVESRQIERITDGTFHVQHFDSSPDGDRFAIGMTMSSHLDDLFAHQSLAVIDRRTGTVERVVSEDFTGDMGPVWSPDGKRIAYTEFTPNRITYHVAVVMLEDGSISYPLGKDYRGTPYQQMKWDADSRHLWLKSVETTRNRVIRADVVDGTCERVDVGDQNFWSFDLSSDGRTIVTTSHDASSPGDVVARRMGKSPLQLTTLNPQVACWPMCAVQEFQWKNPNDDVEVNGLLVKPPDHDGKSPCPTIVLLHGGPFGFWWDGWQGTGYSWVQHLALNGYVVFLPNQRGSMGVGLILPRRSVETGAARRCRTSSAASISLSHRALPTQIALASAAGATADT